MAEKIRLHVQGEESVSGPRLSSGGIEKMEAIHRGKKVLKEKKIHFQMPFPARLWVFYEGETCVYNTAEEVKKDMAKRTFR